MEPEIFESKIRLLLNTFERPAPPESWEVIQGKLRPESSKPFPRATIGLVALACVLLLFAGLEMLQCFSQPDQPEIVPPAEDPKEQFSKGEELFIANCATCHNRNMKDDLTGPALGGVKERWIDYPQEDLYNYVRNSQKMIAEGHPKALAIQAEWQQESIMTSFPNLTDDELEQLLGFVEWRFQQQ